MKNEEPVHSVHSVNQLTNKQHSQENPFPCLLTHAQNRFSQLCLQCCSCAPSPLNHEKLSWRKRKVILVQMQGNRENHKVPVVWPYSNWNQLKIVPVTSVLQNQPLTIEKPTDFTISECWMPHLGFKEICD